MTIRSSVNPAMKLDDGTLPALFPKEIAIAGRILKDHESLVGGFNPIEKYKSNWIISPSKGEHKKIFETTNQSWINDGYPLVN